MIPPVPPNFGFSLLAIPVWRWEETPTPPSEATPVRDVENGPCAGSAEVSAAPPASEPEKRLVFIGYEWRSSVEWSLFPDAPWEHGFDDQAGEIRDATRRHEREEQQDQQQSLAKLQNNDARAARHRDPKSPSGVADMPASSSRTPTD